MDFRIDVRERSTVYDGFFRMDRYVLRHERFEGGWSEPLVREVLERGHAVAVLLHDPALDSVVMVEQFRIGGIHDGRGAWMLELVAGIVEPGEGPGEVAVRESLEEAGCAVGALERVAEYALSPGGSTERVALYYAPIDAAGAGGVHGLAEEGEDILVHVVPVDEALAMVGDGRIASATPVIALQWLALNRDRLRQRPGHGVDSGP